MIELSVCIGSSCHLKGSYNVIQTFQHLIEEHNLHERVAFQATFCMKECHKPGVSVKLNGVKHVILPEQARQFFQQNILALLEDSPA